MFFGRILRKDQNFQLNEQNECEIDGEVLLITNAALAEQTKKASLFLKKGGEQFLIASLSKEEPRVELNLYLAIVDDIELFVKGNGEIHVSGFYQPEKESPLIQFDEKDDLFLEEKQEQQEQAQGENAKNEQQIPESQQIDGQQLVLIEEQKRIENSDENEKQGKNYEEAVVQKKISKKKKKKHPHKKRNSRRAMLPV